LDRILPAVAPVSKMFNDAAFNYLKVFINVVFDGLFGKKPSGVLVIVAHV
jgi:hypothetical protein